MVFISRLRLRNFKSFKAASIQLPKTFVVFAGPNGSGKCVDGETEISLADGTAGRIRDLVDEALANGQVEEIDDGYIARYDSPKEIISLDPATLKFSKRRIAAFVKRKAPDKMLKVRTRAGREIIATEYHPFFVLNNGDVSPIRADELKEGIRIATPRRMPVETRDTLFLELLDSIGNEDGIYVPYNEDAARIITTKKTSTGWEAFERLLGLPNRTLTSFVGSKQAILFPHLVRTLRFCGLSNLEIASSITHVKGRRTGLTRMPWQNSDEFCRFLGYLLAEGSISRANDQLRFTSGSDAMVADFCAIAKNLFGLDAHVYRYKKCAYEVIINSVALRNILMRFGMSYEGAGGKDIPELLFKHSTDGQLSNLLAGLYSGDGYVSDNTVEITLKSEKLTKGIARILLRLGMVPRTTNVRKRETKTGFVGTYFKTSFFGTGNMRAFGARVKMAHEEKRKRLDSLPLKDINPNVDLIEANAVVKSAARDLGINVKKARKEFPRLDAYCYNQCLPSRHGIKHLVSNVLRPVALQKSIESEALAKLELLSESDIFWDEIETIESMEPRDGWVYDLSVSGHHNFVANGIVIHNSNLCDAVRFVMGETSLKSLRAKKVRELIYTGARSAEVEMTFEDEKGVACQIKRAIRDDGKILYRLNGKKTTRSAILEALRKYNLDESGRNTIAQGEVQRIISMQGKERRFIIDSVAGIADFEDKKKEALRELETVETRIKDANLVLGERSAFLEELGRERETAIKYAEAKKKLTNAKGTLLTREVKRLSDDLGDASGLEEKINFNRKSKEQEAAEIEAKIAQVEAKRAAASQELQSKQKTGSVIRRVEELRASCGSKKQLIEDKEAFLKRVEAESETLAKGLAEEQKGMEALKKELEGLRSELKAAESRLSSQGGAAEDEAAAKMRKALEAQEAELARARESLVALTSGISAKKELVEAKRAEEKSINVAGGGEAPAHEKEISRLRKESERIAAEIERSFSRTKEINAEIGKLDREMLELKEKSSIFKVRTSPHLANPALSFISELRQNDGSGVHGTVADLISFDPRYASAVEASGGARLLYVIVDSVDTAASVIEKLKKAKAGRATFIPLDSIKVPSRAKTNGFSSVLDVVEFPERIARAAEYVFADTLLVDTVADAKKIGIGSGRMVTLEGEIFERSGIVSGGRSESGVLAANQLRKIEKELADVRASKDSLVQELYSIRESESRMRAEKSQTEIRMKTLEMELRVADERRAEEESLRTRKKTLNEEIASLEEAVRSMAAEREKLTASLSEKDVTLKALRERLKAAEEGYRRQSEESSRKVAELSASVSSLRATIEGRMNELELRKKDCHGKEERARALDADRKAALQSINEVKRQIGAEEKELGQLEVKIASASKEIEGLFEQMKAHENEFAELGKELAKKRIELDKLAKDMNNLTVRKATAATRLDDLGAELANYPGAEMLDLKKDELNSLIAESERSLAELGNVNMAAIEMYEKKKAEIEEARDRIGKLDVERQAILSMINEIEEHKKEAFFETFQAVSDNFSRMFRHISIGEGHLYLDKPATPFESGLFIKIRRNNMDYSLDALSGGEKTLVALMFIFALQFFKPAPFYILDEVDAALDKANSKNLAGLAYGMTRDSQFIVVSHNDTMMASADSVIGVAKVGGVSRLVGVKLKQVAAS